MVSSFSHRPLTFQMPLHPLWPVNAPCLSAQALANISSTTVTRHTDAIYPVCYFALSRWHTRCSVCWKYWGSVVWAPAFHRRRWPWAWQWLLPSPHQIAPNGATSMCGCMSLWRAGGNLQSSHWQCRDAHVNWRMLTRTVKCIDLSNWLESSGKMCTCLSLQVLAVLEKGQVRRSELYKCIYQYNKNGPSVLDDTKKRWHHIRRKLTGVKKQEDSRVKKAVVQRVWTKYN